ncbi:iron(III) transport system substrate-binding protein [Kitasatospora sp. GAS204A]|uniref:ABC transporter substrate-binding protein n=1 Tax=unclassified Kitasatospora TaxID=2633591 RepID=UPI002474BF4A|nr:extracellular solute-binding protein [Kitasatospora sp. GAS204B]MDH6120981.1 iron(III) transport system substrate-binding protein [Kitasatospora sp. GAS204B]
MLARRSRSRSATALAVTALALGAAMAGCSKSSTSAQPPAAATPAAPAAVADLVTKSHGESGLIMYGNAPTAVIQPLLDDFTKTYPWIKPAYSQLSDNQVYSKYQSEHAQQARSADLLISDSIAQVLQGEQNGLFAGVTPQGLANFPSYTDQGHGVYVMSPDPVLVAWNTKELSGSQIPTSYAQLAASVKNDPSHFPLVSYSPNNPLGYEAVYGLTHILGADTAYGRLDAYGPHTRTMDEGLDGMQYLAQGGASVAWLSSGLAQAVVPQYKGLADYGYMSDATPLVPRLITQTAGAASPASAQLFLDYLYSAEGQQVMCAAGMEASMNDFRSASGCTADLTDLAKHVPANTTYLVPVSQDVVDQQKAITDRWNKALGH